MDDPALRCPACRAFDWYRDGFVMFELDTRGLSRIRVAPPVDPDAIWSCAQCGYEVSNTTLLRRRLDRATVCEEKRPKIAVAFARERDAIAALQIAGHLDEPVDYEMRRIPDERGATDLVVVEAECEEEPTCDKVETVLVGAHGIMVLPTR